MNKQHIIRTCLSIFFLALVSNTYGQEHIFTKQVSKKIDSKNRMLVIDAEKANINISSTASNLFEIEIKFVSKHSDKNKAEYQLSFFKHLFNIKSKEAYVRNYISLGSTDELSGSIVANYTVKVPKNKTINISNSLGDIKIENINGSFTITSKYGNINLLNVQGNITVNSNIGELLVKDCELESNIETSYSNSYFYNSKGTYTIVSNLGAITFNISTAIKNLSINSAGTEISLYNKKCHEFNLSLSTLQGKLFIDKCNLPTASYLITDTRNQDSDREVLIYKNTNLSNHINIKNKFSNISIQ